MPPSPAPAATDSAPVHRDDNNAPVTVDCSCGESLSGLFLVARLADARESQSADDNSDDPDVAANSDVITAVHNAGQAESPEPDEAGATGRTGTGYAVFFVGTNGRLLVVDREENPWRRVAKTVGDVSNRVPFSSSTKLQTYFVRHPDPRLAWALADHLNQGEPASAGSPFEDLPAPVVKSISEQTITIDEDPGLFFPPGPDQYGGWRLFNKMPHSTCKRVMEQVKRLQCHLGALRYPLGSSNAPYKAVNSGDFDLRLMASVHRFQEHAANGTAVELADPAKTVHNLVDANSLDPMPNPEASDPQRAGEKVSWWFLLLNDEPLLPEERLLRSVPPGLVETTTAACIETWIKNGYRKPGKILVEAAAREKDLAEYNKDWLVWLREESAVRLEMWRALTQGLGCEYGIAVNHTFRDIFKYMEKPPPGAAPKSIHKTGLAIDVGVVGKAGDTQGGDIQDYAFPIATWPIRYEAERVLTAPRGSVKKALRNAENAIKRIDKDLEANKKRTAVKEQQIAQNQRQIDAQHERIGHFRDRELPEQQKRIKECQLRLDIGHPDTWGQARVDKEAAEAACLVIEQEIASAEKSIARFESRGEKLNKQKQWLVDERKRLERERAQQKEKLGKREIGKHDYRLRFRLYGHSKLEVYDPEQMQLREDGQSPLSANYDEAIRAGVDEAKRIYQTNIDRWLNGTNAPRSSFKAWHEALLGDIDFDEICTDLKRDPLKTLQGYFRATIWPFQHQPYEPDGGAMQGPLRADQDNEKIVYFNAAINGGRAGPLRANSKAWLNLTALAHRLGLYRISANRTGFRDPMYDKSLPRRVKDSRVYPAGGDAQRPGFGLIVGLFERFWQKDSAHRDLGVIMKRNPDRARVLAFHRDDAQTDMSKEVWRRRPSIRYPGQLDLDFMRRWGEFVGDKKSYPNGKIGYGSYGKALARLPWLMIPLPAGEGEVGVRWDWFRRVEENLAGQFAADWFLVAYAGDHTGMQKRMNDRHFAEGAEWAEILRDDAIPALAAARARMRPSQRRRDQDETVVCLQPIFDFPAVDLWHDAESQPVDQIDNAVDEAVDNVSLWPNDEVFFTQPGIGRTLEWWHYQSVAVGGKSGPMWGEMLAEQGMSPTVLSAARVPPATIGDVREGVFTGGIGYSTKDLESRTTNTGAGLAENVPAPE